MAFAVSFTKRAVCPSATAEECSGHGTCRSGNLADPNFATCACDDGWTASDCNFPSCPAGSYVALPPGADGGPGATCFRGCQGGKRRSSGCDAVVCAPPARAAASGSTGSAANAPTRCVLDECESDLFRVDEEKGTSCVVRCAPDENDAHGPKRLRAECDPETVRSSAREIADDSTQNVTTYGALATAATFAAVALCVVVAAAARGVCDARGDGASVGEKLAGCWRSARGFSEETRGNGGGTCTRTWTRSNARTLTEGSARSASPFDASSEMIKKPRHQLSRFDVRTRAR